MTDREIVVDSVEGETGAQVTVDTVDDLIGEGPVESVSPGATEESRRRVRRQERSGARVPKGFGSGELRILRSPNLEWFFDPERGEWYASYKMPGTDQRVFFNADATQMDDIFGENQRPVEFRRTTFKKLSNRQFFSGGIAEVSGDGRFEAEVKRAFELGLDTSDLPSWARGKEVRNLLYIANQEQKSGDWLLEQISKTDAFARRFGGGVGRIQKRGNMTLAEAVDSFLVFEAGVKDALVDAGMSPKRANPEAINSMLSKGQSIEDVRFVFEGFKRFQGNRQALDSFNQVLAERGLEPLTAKQQIEFMEGKSARGLYQIWEEASFNQAAQEAGLDLSPRQAMRLARRTAGTTSLVQAQKGLQSAAGAILRFGANLDLDQYDIDREDIIDMSVGLAPRSGRSEAEISRNMERALGQARATFQQDPRFNTQRFTQFTPEGVPQAASTSRSRTSS